MRKVVLFAILLILTLFIAKPRLFDSLHSENLSARSLQNYPRISSTADSKSRGSWNERATGLSDQDSPDQKRSTDYETIKPLAKPPYAADAATRQHVEETHKLWLREWEKRRTRIYSEMQLDSEKAEALDDARREFYKSFDSLMTSLQSGISDGNVEQVIQEVERNNEAFDAYVHNLVGTQYFQRLQMALENTNREIARSSSTPVILVSAW